MLIKTIKMLAIFALVPVLSAFGPVKAAMQSPTVEAAEQMQLARGQNNLPEQKSQENREC